MSKPLWEVVADTFDETATVSCRDVSTMLACCKAALRAAAFQLSFKDRVIDEDELLAIASELDGHVFHKN